MPLRTPRIEIEYCPKCRWMLRAAWLAQEILTTFETVVSEVALQPSAASGTFEVRVGDTTVWSRSTEGRFPEAKELKQRIRDVVSPEMPLGHSDR